jgi:cytochrome c553
MTKTVTLQSLALFTCGVFVGSFLFSHWKNAGLRTVAAMEQSPATASGRDIAAMQADIAHLKEVVPSQSHSMTDVAYQFSCLWFAGKENNWPLAAFFLNEARQHIRWTIRIRPIRKDLQGNDVDLKGIYDSIDNSVMVKLQQAIDKKDRVQFVAAYKETLVQCYSCHKASGKPYLRPMVPTVPPQTIINFDPNGKWPE